MTETPELEFDSPERLQRIRSASAPLGEAVRRELVEALEHPQGSPEIREAAAERLAACGSDADRQTLLVWLREHSDPRTRTAIAAALAEYPSPATVAALIEALADPVNTVRNVAERSLLAMLESVAEHGVLRLIELLAHPAPLTRSPAARLLGRVGDRRALQPLLQVLQTDKQWLARMWAAAALGELGCAEAVPALAHALQHDQKNRVRAAAVEAIGRIKPPDALQWLQLAMEDPDGSVKQKAEEAAGRLHQGPFDDA